MNNIRRMKLKENKKSAKYKGIDIPNYEKYMSENTDDYKDAEVEYDVNKNNAHPMSKILAIVTVSILLMAVLVMSISIYIDSLAPKVVEIKRVSAHSAGEIQYKELLKNRKYDKVSENCYAIEEIKIFVDVKEYNDVKKMQYSNKAQIICVNDESNPYYNNVGDFLLNYDKGTKCFSFTATKITNGIYEATFYTYKNVDDKMSGKNAREHKVQIEVTDSFNSKEEALPIINKANDTVIAEKKAAEIEKQAKKELEKQEQERRQAEEDKIYVRYGGFEVLKGVKGTYQYGYTTVKGTLVNNTGMDYSYVEINWNLYDANGNKTDTARDNISGLKDGESWSFKAIGRSESGGSHQFDSIDAW